MNDKVLLFSISKAKGDFRIQAYRGTGNGGQKKNKTSNACRIWHDASGAVTQCEEQRSFEQNKKRAFEKLLETEKFKTWHKIEIAKKLGLYKDDEEYVEEQMQSQNIKVEEKVNGKWVEVVL